jgi:glycosyltransferase involved in cell wall biosynthesis
LEPRKKILFVTNGIYFSESERSLLDLIRKLDAEKYEAGVLLLSDGPTAVVFREAGVPVRILQAPDILLGTPPRAFFTKGYFLHGILLAKEMRLFPRAAADVLRAEKADLVYTNMARSHILGGRAGRIAGVPVVWRIRDYYSVPMVRLAFLWAARRLPQLILCCSRFTASQFGRNPRVCVVYGDVNPEAARPNAEPAAVRQALGIPADAPLVGMAQDLQPHKGHDVFLRAAARIREDVRDASFLVIGNLVYGENDMRDRLSELAADYGIADCVTFTGMRADEADLINALDVFVHPVQRPDTFGRGIVTAMLCGKPVVAAGIGGPEEIVRHTETGALVEPSDSVALARAVVQLLDNPEVAAVLGNNGRARALELFTLDRTMAEIEKYFEMVLKIG